MTIMTEKLVKYLQECRAAGIIVSLDSQHGNTINDLCRVGKINGPITVGDLRYNCLLSVPNEVVPEYLQEWPNRFDTRLGRFVR